MSIAIPYTLFSAFVAAVVILLIARRHASKSRAFGCISAIVCFPILCVVMYPIVIYLGTSERFDLSRRDAERNGLSLSLPQGATQINFSQHFHQKCFVDFSIDEAAFLKWCDQHHWKAIPIDSGLAVYPLNIQHQLVPFDVTDGYRAVTFPIDGDCGGDVVYDQCGGRAYYRFHSY